jgi:type I restriction enzyme M protein
MKAQEAPQNVRQFFKVLLDISYRHDLVNVFDDFLTIVTCVYAWQTKEEEYLRTIKKYTKEELNGFAKALAELTLIYGKEVSAETWIDPLGIIYEVIAGNFKRSRLGQFFTPKSICDLMAQIQIDKPSEITKTVNDPACGSGRLPLAVTRVNSNVIIYAEDLDPMCCKMAAINFLFHGVKAQVSNLNSLTLDQYFRGYLVNWHYAETQLLTCLDLPQEKCFTWSYWQQKREINEAKQDIEQLKITFSM